MFEWLHTDPIVEVVPGTVRHFERYPAMTAPDGKPATPDFTIAFNDGPAIVGEIARFSLRPESIDSLCSQIGRYDTLVGVPGANGKIAPRRSTPYCSSNCTSACLRCSASSRSGTTSRPGSP